MLIPISILLVGGAVITWLVYLLREKNVALRRAERNCAKVLSNITDAFIALDEHWRFTYISQRAGDVFRLLGKDPDEMIDTRYWDQFPGVIGTNVEAEFRRARDEKTSVSFESFFAENRRWFEMNAYSTDDGLSVFFRDITQRKVIAEETQTALRELNDVKFALDQHAIVAITDPAGKITYVNDKFCAISKYAREELIGQDHRIINSGHHPKEFFRDLWRTISSGHVWKGEIKNRAKDGSFYWVDTTIVPYLGEDGKPKQYIAIRADITERKNAEERTAVALRELGDLKAALDEHAIVAITDPAGKITYVNDKFCAISKYAREELIGQDHRIINSGYHSKEFIRDLWRTIGSGHVWKGEIKNRAKDGSFYWVDTTIVPYLGEDGKPKQYIAIRADITERKNAEEALKNAQQALQAHAATLEQTVAERTAMLREKIGELEAFSYSISHDMRQPLRSMQGYARVLLSDYGGALDEEAKRYLERIRSSANRLDRLIQDVLTYSKATRAEGRLVPIDLGRMVREVVEIYPMLKAVDVEVATGEAFVLGYEAILTQCISNLLTNAVKFVVKDRVPNVRVWTESRGQFVRLCVKDNGIGIAPVDQQRIFDIFSRIHADTAYEGTGIGLSIVKKAVEKMGGRVGVESELGKGSLFWIDLPRATNHTTYD